MRNIRTLSVLLLTTCSQAFAGGTGGGGVLSMAPSPAMAAGAAGGYVRYVGVDRGEVLFDYKDSASSLIEGYRSRSEEFDSQDQAVVKALHESKLKNSWVPLVTR